MAKNNLLWGAERIRGELLKLGIRVSKRTIQKYISRVRPPGHRGQTWGTFISNHSHDIWARDFLQLYDVLDQPVTGNLTLTRRQVSIEHVPHQQYPTHS